MSILAENLKFLRKKADLTQTKFGEKYGLNRGNIDSYEKGTEPRLKALLEIASDNQVNLTMLLTFKMTTENFHLFAEEYIPSADVAEDPAAVYGDAEFYTLIRDVEDANSLDDRRKYTKELVKMYSKVMTELTTVRRELTEELKKK